MRQKLQTLLFALVAMMMPIGAWAFVQSSVEITIGQTGVVTYYNSSYSLVIPEGISASIITGVEKNSNGTVTVIEEDVTGIIPADCAVILRGDKGSYTFEVTYEDGSSYASNLLLGSDEETTIGEEGYLYFTLDSENEENSASLKDWIYGGNQVLNEAHKAYLALPVDGYPELAAMLEALDNPHLQHTHGGCEICGEKTGVEAIEAAWGASADDLTEGTLEDAIFNAGEEGSNIGYIKLLADVESEIAISVNGGNFTLDLNGHTISSKGHTLDIQYESNVTIVDNSGTNEGKVISTGDGCFAVCVAEGATVTINGGSYINSSYMPVYIGEGCSATIMDGIFEYTSYGAIDNYGNLVVEGGTFTYKGDGEGDESSPTIFYYGGSIDLSKYSTDAINSIDVINNSGEDITPGAETILLPEGCCFFDSEGTPVTVLVYEDTYYIGEEPAQYAITFEANGGEGNMEGSNIYEGVDYTLPECTFKAPEGMMFKAWQIGEDEYQPYKTVTIMDNTTITALWTDYVPQIVIKMHDSYGDGWQDNAIVVMKNGEEIGTATIEVGRDGIVRYDYDNSADYTFYWQSGGSPEECSFEIFIDDEEVFAAVRDDVEGTSDCESYGDGVDIYTIEGEAQVVESFTINDGELTEYSNDASFTTVGILTYTRTLPNQEWNALYVPFEIPVNELLDNYDVAYFNNMHAYDRDVDGAIDEMEMEVIFIKEGTLHANHPYFIRAKSEAAQELTLELSDATLYSTAEGRRTSITTSSAYMEFILAGVYEQKTGEDGVYAINTEGAWSPIAEGAKLNPFRLFLQMTTRSGSPVKVDASAAKAFRIRAVGDDTTGIEDSEFRNQNSELVYDLMGRRVLEPQKGGIYIVDGKKVVW